MGGGCGNAWCRGSGSYLSQLTKGTKAEYRGVDGVTYPVSTKGGWFLVDRPIKNENGNEKVARTWLRHVASGTESCVVLCRPETGRWHQIRKHLNGLSVPIIGDGVHGNSKVNRVWRERGMPESRIGLHLLRLDLPATENLEAVDVEAGITEDLRCLIEAHVDANIIDLIEADIST